MREIRFEYLRPRQILEAMKEKSIVYLPVSPIEWHGLHNPVGVDGFHAYESALEAARRIGGVVMPPIYAGQGGRMREETLRNLGFEEPYPKVNGIDVPANLVPSMYWDEDISRLMIKEQIRLVAAYGFKMIVIVVNHGALSGVAEEMDEKLENCKVIFTSCVGAKFDEYDDRGHATMGESSIVMYIRNECVDLTELPSKEEEPYLLCRDHGVIDARFFNPELNTDYRLLKDPRDATCEMGKEFFESGVKQVIDKVSEEYEKLHI